MEKARQYTALALLAALCACGAPEEAAEVPPAPPIPYAGPVKYPAPGETPANAEAYIWGYSGEDAHILARGVPESDLVDVIFRCQADTPAVQFGFFQSGPAPKTVRFGSGAATAEYLVKANPPEFSVSDAWTLSGELQAGEPAFKAFIDTGRMTRWYGDKPHVWDARTAKDREAIKAFAEACKDKL